LNARCEKNFTNIWRGTQGDGDKNSSPNICEIFTNIWEGEKIIQISDLNPVALCFLPKYFPVDFFFVNPNKIWEILGRVDASCPNLDATHSNVHMFFA